jgi:DNA-binding Lrp family transcriptional regulator
VKALNSDFAEVSIMKDLKNVEIRLIAELMKNSRRSDRELAKVLGVSQPTVSRTVAKLVKEGYIKEFTAIPDFKKIGFQVMSIVLSDVKEKVTQEAVEESRKKIRKEEREKPNALLFGYSGMGLNSDRASILLSRNYAEYSLFLKHAKEHPLVEIGGVQTFLIDLNDETHYMPLTFSQVALYLEKKAALEKTKKH